MEKLAYLSIDQRVQRIQRLIARTECQVLSHCAQPGLHSMENCVLLNSALGALWGLPLTVSSASRLYFRHGPKERSSMESSAFRQPSPNAQMGQHSMERHVPPKSAQRVHQACRSTEPDVSQPCYFRVLRFARLSSEQQLCRRTQAFLDFLSGLTCGLDYVWEK